MTGTAEPPRARALLNDALLSGRSPPNQDGCKPFGLKQLLKQVYCRFFKGAADLRVSATRLAYLGVTFPVEILSTPYFVYT